MNLVARRFPNLSRCHPELEAMLADFMSEMNAAQDKTLRNPFDRSAKDMTDMAARVLANKIKGPVARNDSRMEAQS